MSKLHGSLDLLPAGITPEAYLKDYLARDMSMGPNRVTEMRLLHGEDPHFYNSQYILDLCNGSPLNSAPTSTKPLRCSYMVNDIATEGSFVIRTKDLNGSGTQIDYLLGIFAPADKFDANLPMLLEALNSIQLTPYYQDICMSGRG